MRKATMLVRRTTIKTINPSYEILEDFTSVEYVKGNGHTLEITHPSDVKKSWIPSFFYFRRIGSERKHMQINSS